MDEQAPDGSEPARRPAGASESGQSGTRAAIVSGDLVDTFADDELAGFEPRRPRRSDRPDQQPS
ncbi:hypothetical protein APR04_002723 [Promicromonospora umidemergens]|nr:hypothetical protein [Promicromonospora umidemergens]